MIIPFLIYLAITLLASILNLAILSPVSMVVPHDIQDISWSEIFLKYIVGFLISGLVVIYSYIKSYREV